jgi:LysM repeat protein/CheY-like chemotaxis protein
MRRTVPSVLVVATDPAEARAVAEQLAGAGFRPRWVGAAEVERSARAPVDLLVFAPSLSGAATLRALDALVPPEARRLPAVLRLLPADGAQPIALAAGERWLRGPLGAPELARAAEELLAAARAEPGGRGRLARPLLVAAVGLALAAGLAGWPEADPASPPAEIGGGVLAPAEVVGPEAPAAVVRPEAPAAASPTAADAATPTAESGPARAEGADLADATRPTTVLGDVAARAAPEASVERAAPEASVEPGPAGAPAAGSGGSASAGAPTVASVTGATEVLAPALYTVVWGDTLWAIAIERGTSVAALVELNRIPNPDLILAGQVLLLPPPG